MVAITKLLVFILIFCILYVVKEAAEFLLAWFTDRAQFDTKNGRVWNRHPTGLLWKRVGPRPTVNKRDKPHRKGRYRL